MYYMGYKQEISDFALEKEMNNVIPAYNNGSESHWPSAIISTDDIKAKGGFNLPLVKDGAPFKVQLAKTSEEQWFLDYLAKKGL